MTTPTLKFSKTRAVKSPNRGTSKSAGIDFFVPSDFTTVWLKPGESTLIPSGIKVEVPTGHALIAFNKSGIATKRGLQVGASVVDEDYQGEVHIHLVNIGKQTSVIEANDKIIQFILIPVLYADVVEDNNIHQTESERGAGGFGSTGEN